jgi:tetratricopeptide (TPR) repeat protein
MKQHDTSKIDHAYSRYSCISLPVIDQLQKEHLAGREPARLFPDLDPKEATIIVSESLEADRLLNNINSAIASGKPFSPPSDGYSDWSLVTAAKFFHFLAEEFENLGDIEQHDQWWAMGWATLEKAALSPTASPMIWYEDLYQDLSEQLAMNKETKALDYLNRALAHSFVYDQGQNANMYLRDIVNLYLQLGKYNKGFSILTGLLNNDPSDIWIYNLIAITFARYGFVKSGIKATRRALELIEATGDPEELYEQLDNALISFDIKNNEHRINKKVLALFNAALELDFDSGPRIPVDDLCAQLIPNLDRTPVKKSLV